MATTHNLAALDDEFDAQSVFFEYRYADMVMGTMGTIALWIGFFGMFAAFLYFGVLHMSTTPGKRFFHIVTMAIVGFASTTYLFMAVGDGCVMTDGRPFYYARYLDWIVTTPLLLLDLASLAGASTEDTVLVILMDVLMILAGLGGGVHGNMIGRYLLWLLGMIWFVPVLYTLVVTFKGKADEMGSAASQTYKTLSYSTVMLWSAYPVVWFFAEGNGVISPTVEAILYCILDLTAKAAFGFVLLTSRTSLEQVTGGYSSVGSDGNV